MALSRIAPRRAGQVKVIFPKASGIVAAGDCNLKVLLTLASAFAGMTQTVGGSVSVENDSAR
jgi:hypothetical protein